MSVNDKVMDSLIDNFQAYTNPSQPVAVAFEKELKTQMESRELTNLDDSKESAEVISWIQEEMPKYGGSVQSPLNAEAIMAWDDAAYEAVMNDDTPDSTEMPKDDDASFSEEVVPARAVMPAISALSEKPTGFMTGNSSLENNALPIINFARLLGHLLDKE